MIQQPVKFARYEVLGTLGRGGFATVYRARDRQLGREVALKLLSAHLAEEPDVRRRFLSEARILANLRHPNIVTVYDVGEDGGRPYFTMDLIPGVTLAQMLDGRQGLPLPQVVEILNGLASAVDYLHAAGLIHRDIKPANVMREYTGRVVLMDFGIARVLDGTQFTRTGMTLGTPEYMAPEQIRAQPIGPPADIYALGILTYALLAGHPPFEGDTASVLHAQAYDEPPPLEPLRTGLYPQAYATIAAALAKNPEERPPSAAHLADVFAVPTPVDQAFTQLRPDAQATKTVPLHAFSPTVLGPTILATKPSQVQAFPWRTISWLGLASVIAIVIDLPLAAWLPPILDGIVAGVLWFSRVSLGSVAVALGATSHSLRAGRWARLIRGGGTGLLVVLALSVAWSIARTGGIEIIEIDDAVILLILVWIGVAAVLLHGPGQVVGNGPQPHSRYSSL
ncbi:MAG: serine/threonine-protein kinase, partial [Dehalococcoidia bacterium]